jgi:hypothetical protein
VGAGVHNWIVTCDTCDTCLYCAGAGGSPAAGGDEGDRSGSDAGAIEFVAVTCDTCL